MAGLEAIHLARLNEAFTGRLCVSAWLGYGDPILLGLGDEVLVVSHGDRQRPKPPFELQTNFSDWAVDPPHVCSSKDHHDDLEAAAASLVGQSVVGWQLLPMNQLRLVFDAGHTLTVTPWPREKHVTDAWNVTAPDGRLVAVSTDGRAVIVDSTQPIRDWFR